MKVGRIGQREPQLPFQPELRREKELFLTVSPYQNPEEEVQLGARISHSVLCGAARRNFSKCPSDQVPFLPVNPSKTFTAHEMNSTPFNENCMVGSLIVSVFATHASPRL